MSRVLQYYDGGLINNEIDYLSFPTKKLSDRPGSPRTDAARIIIIIELLNATKISISEGRFE